MTTMTRTIRLAIGAAAVLALTSPAAQARPGLIGDRPQSSQTIHHVAIPASPAGRVWLAHENGSLTVATPQVSAAKPDSGGFAWGAAAIGAGSALAVGALGAAALITLRRRRVPVST